MKKLAVIGLLAALSATAAPTLAQTTAPTPSPAMRAQFKAMRSHMMQIHTTERSQILGALTPANRSLLASIAGQLATSVTPDYKGAVTRLDSALSASEKQRIISAAQAAHTQQRSLMQSMRAAMPHPQNMQRPARPHWKHVQRTPDAGRILLGLAAGREMHMHGPHRR